jgi:flagellar biosynthesis chaperone FliJ
MQQITGLIDKVLQDQSIAHQALKLTRERTVLAQREKLKMQALVEQDQQRQRMALQKQEQRQMDEVGLRQFHFRQVTGHP